MEKINVPEKMKINDDLSSYQAKVMKDLKENKEVYSRIQLLGLKESHVKNNLGTLLTFYEDSIVCQNCPGIENCPKEEGCCEIGLTFDGQFVGITKSPCKKVNEQMKFDSYFIYSDFDPSLRGKTLEDVNKSKVRNPLLVQMMKAIQGQSKEWIYIRGKFNSGRSYMATCFATTFAMANSNPVAFANTATLVEQLKTLSISNKELFNNKLKALENCPLVVLDGFGDEYKSDFNFSQVIFPLLSERFRKGLMTVFTSDFEVDEIVDMYSSKVSKPRARQLKSIFEAAVSKDYILDGVTLY